MVFTVEGVETQSTCCCASEERVRISNSDGPDLQLLADLPRGHWDHDGEKRVYNEQEQREVDEALARANAIADSLNASLAPKTNP